LDGRTGALTFAVGSRWNGWKGHRTLLAAWDRLDTGRLIVLGGPPPSGDAVDVPALVRALRRPDSVVVVGEVDDISPYITQADVVVMPSDRPEPFGLVAIEAFARGRPVIASAAGGLLDIISDGIDGWLFPPQDVEALAGIMSRLVRSTVVEAGRAARTTYERRYTTARYAEQWWSAVSSAAG
jgi:glycosyltransferase involved in cell wall biosynthesis